MILIIYVISEQNELQLSQCSFIITD